MQFLEIKYCDLIGKIREKFFRITYEFDLYATTTGKLSKFHTLQLVSQ